MKAIKSSGIEPMFINKTVNKMKTNIKFILTGVLLFGCLFGCKKDNGPAPIIDPIDDNSLPSAAILRVVVLEKTNDRLKFQLDLAVFRDSENIEDNLKSENFSIDSLTFRGNDFGFSNNLSKLISGTAKKNYSALMLMDQSGSISSTDRENYRLDAAKIFCNNLGTGNDVALWSFSGSTHNELVAFTTDTAMVIQEIEKLRGKEGGGTPLYQSQYEAISYTKSNSAKPNKAVLTFTDGQGSGSSDNVASHALSQDVSLYNVGLGDVNTVHLQQQAVATGGAFMYAKDARQLISIFGNLGKLLSNTAIYYQTEWTISHTDSPNLFQGSGDITHEITIRFPFGGEIQVPFRISYE